MSSRGFRLPQRVPASAKELTSYPRGCAAHDASHIWVLGPKVLRGVNDFALSAMLEDGKLSAAEAESLLDALEQSPTALPSASGPTELALRDPKYLRVLCE